MSRVAPACHPAVGRVGQSTPMDKRWQMVLDGLGAEQPPFSQGTLFNVRLRLIAHNLDKTRLDRTVALAEKTGGCGARPLRAVLDSTPLFGAGRVEDTLTLLGQALRTRTAVEHALAQQWAPQGRRARYRGLRKNPFDGRRHAAVSHRQVAAHSEEVPRLAS
jgi:hypothetical protein